MGGERTEGRAGREGPVLEGEYNKGARKAQLGLLAVASIAGVYALVILELSMRIYRTWMAWMHGCMEV